LVLCIIVFKPGAKVKNKTGPLIEPGRFLNEIQIPSLQFLNPYPVYCEYQTIEEAHNVDHYTFMDRTAGIHHHPAATLATASTAVLVLATTQTASPAPPDAAPPSPSRAATTVVNSRHFACSI